MTTIPYFTRLRLALRTFFSVVDFGRVPDEVAAALGMPPARPAEPPAPAPPPAAPPAPEPDTTRAAQLLAILQRDGRLVDFLMEEIAPYEDAQIGAAVRDVHANTRQALLRYVTLDPVIAGDEGHPVTVEPGTDPAAIKVIGNVGGQPPYRGVLRHRGWRVTRLELPPLPAAGHAIVAPAEVEVP